jgi:hypothetical protein
MNSIRCITVAGLVALFSTCALAQTDEWGDPLPQEQPAAQQPATDEWGNPLPAQPAAQPVVTSPAPEEPVAEGGIPDSGRNLKEEKDVGYHSAGLRWRWIFVPKWFITMFNVDIASQSTKRPLISNFGIGAEYTYRKNDFDITAAFWGAQIDWEKPIYFKSSDEPQQSWTQVTNGMSAILLTVDFIWSTPIRDWVAITYGVGLGMGFTIGDPVTETEAWVDPNTGALAPCIGPGNPGTSINGVQYCEAGGEYDEEYEKLKVIPWINLLVGARFKPHEHIAIYVDGGFGIGFQMGLRAGYIF